MKELLTAALLCVSASHVDAQTQLKAHHELMSGLAQKYAEAAARLHLCGTGPGRKGLEDIAETWAEWAKPGFINSITRQRSAFQGDARAQMERWFSIETLAEDCSRITAPLNEALLWQIERGIVDLTELPFDG
ncbi:hypothetical protein [Pseudooceanicola nanhaiensis]|uniref:hypothetical protein n=1 Tax=Pseudooceanicola nanhaiensis TaxID=375761 RepID=UPI0035156755